ncbi:hypothetical protein [Alloprevotella rava]|uniref:hypothetical protein n=1 Tax=Alloprevotella rava TaxID=671218 RepID=UPI001E2AD130|nr:hypothetical protein [Alloprevotella rava]
MIFLRHIEHAHPPVVGADVVQCLHPLKRIADGFRLLLPLAVYVQGFLEAALVAQCLAPFPQGDDAAEPVILAFQPLL